MSQNILSFNEFVERIGPRPRYDNFIYFFYPNSVVGEALRTQPFFIKFQEYYPDLEAKLSEEIPKIRKNNPTFQGLEPIEKELYQAYCFMRSYDVDDESLIGLANI